MTRLERLREMRAWLDAEIAHEERNSCDEIHRAAQFYGVDVSDVLDARLQSAPVTRARHAAAWLLHRRGLSLSEVARLLGYRDRKTVMYACSKIDRSPAVRALLIGIEAAA